MGGVHLQGWNVLEMTLFHFLTAAGPVCWSRLCGRLREKTKTMTMMITISRTSS